MMKVGFTSADVWSPVTPIPSSLSCALVASHMTFALLEMKNQAVCVKHGTIHEFFAKSTEIKGNHAGIQHLVIKEQRLISNRMWSNERSRQSPENQLGRWRRQIDTMSQGSPH